MPTPNPNAIVVSPSGNDSNPGTVASPVLTLGQAQTLVRASSTKIVYLRSGIYPLTSTLILTAASDAGETWTTYPLDPVDSGIIDGGSTAFSIFQVDADNVTIDNMTLRNFTNNGVKHDQGGLGAGGNINNITVTNCEVGPGGTGANNSGGIAVNGVNGCTVKNNYLHDLQSFGIQIQCFQTGLVMDNVVVDSNVLLRCCLSNNDCGAIYFEGFNGYVSTSIQITNNYVKDIGAPGIANVHDIYLDLGTNHTTISGNVLAPINIETPVSSAGALFLDGYSNHITGNIIDIGSTGREMTCVWWYQTPPGFTVTDNTFTGNIVIMSHDGESRTAPFGLAANFGYPFYQNNSVAGNYTITNNVYYNYFSGQIRMDGLIVGDSSPIVENPQITGMSYNIAAGSPVFNSPVNFPPIAGGWGPPGFAIQRDGVIPSHMLGRSSMYSFDQTNTTGSTVTLSYGGVTATHFTGGVAAGTTRGIRSTQNGKRYMELYIDVVTVPANYGIGIVNASESIGNFLGGSINSIGYYGDHSVYYNNSVLTTIDPFQHFDTVQMAVDIPNGKVWFRVNGGNWNATPGADPATNTSGITLGVSGAVFPSIEIDNPNMAATANFGNTPYIYSPPIGFINWPQPPEFDTAGFTVLTFP
jgi:hypothetical protein